LRKKIGECLIDAGLITEHALDLALAEHLHTGERVGAALVRMQFTTETEVARALAGQLGFPYIDLRATPPDPRSMSLIPRQVALERACVAVRADRGRLTVAMSDPLRFTIVQDLSHATGHFIQQAIAPLGDIVDAIERGYSDQPPADAGVAETLDHAAGAPGPAAEDVADVVDAFLQRAVRLRASDVHVEPVPGSVRVRYRVDGVLMDATSLPTLDPGSFVACLKSRAGLDPGESRLAQNGRLRVTSLAGTDLHFRLSTFGTIFGEKVVLRVLEGRERTLSLDELGLSSTALALVRTSLAAPRGLMLIVGPRASGKTTTAHAAIASVSSDARSVIAIEDPIEYVIPGASQIVTGERTPLLFASAMKASLGSDADVVFLGDIPDAETAMLAVDGANGRLVLATLDVPDATAAVSRLRSFGIEADVLASVLTGVVVQRLVRRLCFACRRPCRPSSEVLGQLDLADSAGEPSTFFAPVGCDQCSYTGYRGRLGIFEVRTIGDLAESFVAAGDSGDVRTRRHDGPVTFGDDGVSKVDSGVTSAEELLRVAGPLRGTRPLCTACGSLVGPEFLACPHCGRRTEESCRYCARTLRPGWRFCPFCARRAGERITRGGRPGESAT